MSIEISSLQNSFVKHLVRLRQNRDYREEHHSIFIEGIKLVNEVGKSQPVKALVATDPTLLPKDVSADHIYIVSDAVMKKISGMQSPEGLAAEIATPKHSSLSGKSFLLAYDGINDPGNLGTLLRSALALGWEGAFILDNSCDPYNEKAIRAAKGATFRLPIAVGSWKELKEIIKNNCLEPFVADIKGEKIQDMKLKNGILLVLSNEAHGVSDEAAKQCRRLTIPMSGQMESLNVAAAGAIFMYALKSVER